MKLSDRARAHGISYKTAWLGWKQGKLPVPVDGTILAAVPNREGAVPYARVSSADQRAESDRQVARLATFAAERGLLVGSGRDGHRTGLLAVLRSHGMRGTGSPPPRAP